MFDRSIFCLNSASDCREIHRIDLHYHQDTVRSVCRLSLCGVNKAPLKLLSSVQCAPHSLGVNGPLLIGSSASRRGFIAKPPSGGSVDNRPRAWHVSHILQCPFIQERLPNQVLSLLRRGSPFHGLVDIVQREVARQCGLAYLLLFQALLLRGNDVKRHSLDVCFARCVQRAKTNLVADLHWQGRFQSGPNGRCALCRSEDTATKSRYAHKNGWASCVSSHLESHLLCVDPRLFLHVVRFGARCLDQHHVPHRRR